MSVTEILKELPKLSAKDLAQVFRFVHDLEVKQRMSGRQLSGLAEKLPHASDPKEAARLRQEIGRGFYGMTVCGEGELVKTFLTPDQVPYGKEV